MRPVTLPDCAAAPPAVTPSSTADRNSRATLMESSTRTWDERGWFPGVAFRRQRCVRDRKSASAIVRRRGLGAHTSNYVGGPIPAECPLQRLKYGFFAEEALRWPTDTVMTTGVTIPGGATTRTRVRGSAPGVATLRIRIGMSVSTGPAPRVAGGEETPPRAGLGDEATREKTTIAITARTSAAVVPTDMTGTAATLSGGVLTSSGTTPSRATGITPAMARVAFTQNRIVAPVTRDAARRDIVVRTSASARTSTIG